MKAREQALYAALDDMESWLATGAVINLCKLQNLVTAACINASHIAGDY